MSAFLDAIAPVFAVLEGVSADEWLGAAKALAADLRNKTTIPGAALDVIAAAVPTLDEDIALLRFGLAIAPYLQGKDLGAIAPTPYTPGEQIGDLDVDS